jgi:hypothetical protein
MPTMSGIELQSHLCAKGYRVPFIFSIIAFPEESIRARTLTLLLFQATRRGSSGWKSLVNQ